MICNNRLFSPIQYQTVFLGCSVSSFSAQIGYNDQTSQLTVKLYQDPCLATGENYKATYDIQTKRALDVTQDVSEYLFQNADPGFVMPDAGEPVYFRVGDHFEMGGVIQSYAEIRDSSQNPGYSVSIQDPREILQGSQVVLGGYVGGIYSTPNIFNLYGFSESLGSTCLDALLDDLTGPAAYGGSQRNEAGISWNRIRRTLSVMTSHLPKLVNNWGLGRIKFGDYEYMLDWSEIPLVTGYRFTATSLSISDIINEICTFLGLDYFVQLLHMYDEGGTLQRIIKIRTVSRRVQPDLNQISNFIGDGQGVIESSKGRELRNETCSSVLVGGPKQELFVQTSNHETIYNNNIWKDLTISPFWGFNPDGGVIIGRGLNMDHNFDIDISAANIADETNSVLLRWYNISVAELHAAMAGKDVWTSYVAVHKSSLMNALGLDESPLSFWDCFIKIIQDLSKNVPGDLEPIVIHQARIWNILGEYLRQVRLGIAGVPNFVIGPYDIISMRKFFTEAFDNWINDTANYQRIQFNLDTLFQIVENYATNYYGKQFMVRLTTYNEVEALQDAIQETITGQFSNLNDTFICTRYDSESDLLVHSKEVSDGGWTDFEDNLMGVQNEILLDRFRLNDGRIQAFVRFNVAEYLKFPELNTEDFIYQDLDDLFPTRGPTDSIIFNPNRVANEFQKTLFVKCNVNKQFIFPSNGQGYFDYTDPRVVIELPGIVKFHNANLDTIPYFLQFLFREGQAIQAPNNPNAPEFAEEDLISVFKSMMSNVGASALHTGEDFLRVAPNAVCLPFKSNIETYGPWFAIGANGKTNYVQNEELVPWNYGSTVSMNNSAALLATSELTNMLQGEAGYISVPGLPALNLGDELQSGGSSITTTRNILLDREELEGQEFSTGILESEGQEGVYGPNVSNIDVSLAVNGGATTKYSFRTFTPAFGNTNRYLAERLKNRSIRAQQRRREFRETFSQQDIRRLVNDIINQRIKDRQNDTGLFPKSPHLVLVGQNIAYPKDIGETDAFTRSFVHTQNLMESKSELANWQYKHFMSLDGLLRPIHTSGFYSYKDSRKEAEDPAADVNKLLYKNAAPAIPPTDQSNSQSTRITAYTLNPFVTNNVGVNNLDKEEYPFANNSCGHDIEYLARGTDFPEDLAIQHNDDYASALITANNTVNYRAMALRGPLLLTGWGFDINNKPVPNASGEDGPSDKFLANWLKRSDQWKTGPVDLRWDNRRGVWTAFPGYSLVQAMVTEVISHEWEATGLARLINLPEDAKLVDEDGKLIQNNNQSDSSPKIIISNTAGYPLRPGMKVICYYNMSENKYWILEAPPPIYAIRLTTNIMPIPQSNGEHIYSGQGNLDFAYLNYFNHHLGQAASGTVSVFSMGLPLSKSTDTICIERQLNSFWVLRSQSHPLCIISDVNCSDIYTSDGTQSALEVCDRTIWIEGNYTRENCGESGNFIGGCGNGYDIEDFELGRD